MRASIFNRIEADVVSWVGQYGGGDSVKPRMRVTMAGLFLLILVLASFAAPRNINASTIPNPDDPTIAEDSWPMLAANPERTSWTPEEVRGDLNVDWYRPIEPYIPYKIQPIAANGNVYISTAGGLYTFSAGDGDLMWTYATEVPLGHSPTIATVSGKSVAYVGGYDRKIHAVDALTGQPLPGYSAFIAEAGFETNPLVVNDTIYAGNRDGYFYALDAVTGSLRWRFQTDGPILFSAAYKDGAVYFASNDAHAYAIDGDNGSLIWKSQKLPGSGFHSYWPVVYTAKSTGEDYVIFSSGENVRFSDINLVVEESDTIYDGIPDGQIIGATSTTIPGDWADGTVAIDANILTDYLESKPYRRTVLVLDADSGEESTFDSDGDGQAEYAPFNWSGVTHSGTRYPPIINGLDGVYYQSTGYIAPGWISRSGPVGWKFNTQYISQVNGEENGTASDEPLAYSSGGKVVYYALCCDRIAGGMDISIPFGQPNRAWTYYGYNLANNSLTPGYQQMYDTGDEADYQNENGWQVYSGKNQSRNGVYGKHSNTQSPPIPYQGKLFVLKGNALIAFSPTGTGPKVPLPLAATVPTTDNSAQPDKTVLAQRLEAEVQLMLAAGVLRPGYHDSGFYDLYGSGRQIDERALGEIFDYFQNPADTVFTLLLAYPHLSTSTQQQVKTYLQDSYGPGAEYDFTRIVHTGWGTGAARDVYDVPSEVSGRWGEPYHSPYEPSSEPICGWCGYWQHYPPFSFYAGWQYARIVGEGDRDFAQDIFDRMSDKLEAPLDDAILLEKPYWLNAYIAGYHGYLELEKLSGNSQDQDVLATYQHLLDLRVSGFAKDTPYPALGSGSEDWELSYHNAFAVARNFMSLTPELADYLNQHISDQVQEAVTEYESVAPYWFVSKFDVTYGEGTFHHLYDYPALFQAKAYVLKEPYGELAKWLDVPAFYQGDLFYIQNLAAALSAMDVGPPPDFEMLVDPTLQSVESGGAATYVAEITHREGFTAPVSLQAGPSSSPEVAVAVSSPSVLQPPGGQVTITLTHTPSAQLGTLGDMLYTVPITAAGEDVSKTATIRLLVANEQTFLPSIHGDRSTRSAR